MSEFKELEEVRLGDLVPCNVCGELSEAISRILENNTCPKHTYYAKGGGLKYD